MCRPSTGTRSCNGRTNGHWCMGSGAEVEVPGDEEGRRRRRLPRHQGRRPVPLARRRRPQVEGRRRLGRGRRTRSPFALPRSHPRARGDQEAAHRAVELREVSPPRPRTAAGTSSPRTTACRTRPSSTCRTRSTASRRCCSTRTPGRKDGTVALAGPGGQRRRQAPRLRRRRGRVSDWNTWKVLDVDDRQAARRRAEVGQVLRRVVDARTARASSTAASPSRRRATQFQGLNAQPEALLPPLGTPQSDDVLVYERPDQPEVGRRRRASPRTAATWSSPSARAPTSRKYRIVYKDLTEPDAQAGRT